MSPAVPVVRATSCALESQATSPCLQPRLPLSMHGALWPTHDVGAGDTPNYRLSLSPFPPGDRALALWRVVLINTNLSKILL